MYIEFRRTGVVCAQDSGYLVLYVHITRDILCLCTQNLGYIVLYVHRTWDILFCKQICGLEPKCPPLLSEKIAKSLQLTSESSSNQTAELI